MVEVYQELAELISQGRSCVLITVAESQGSGPMTLGKKLLIRDDFSSVGTIGGGALEFEAIETAKEVFHQRESRLAAYLLDENQQIADHKTIPMICGGTVKLFYEYLSGGEKAYIFGGGHVGRALVRQLDLLGFYTTIVEDREDVFQDIAEGKERVFQSFDAFIQKADIDEQAFVVVCTPSHENDYLVVQNLIDKGVHPRYIGMLASPAKKQDFLERITKKYGADLDLSHLYSPIGLDIGGPSPAEIALATAAEMLAVKYGKNPTGFYAG
jgi:xanthine dehydrogenase accessory factor